MNLSLGIVGLPNVGKSTLFNALTNQNIPAENYPFCTIDPNVGIVPVADSRLYKIAEIAKPQKTIPAVVEFVDIAGLVKGAAKGEGLGNQFLANIREVNAIIHLVRAFRNPNITHVENSVDPARDIELIHTELILKDVDTVEKRIKALESKARVEKDAQKALDYVRALLEHLNSGKLANSYAASSDEECMFERAQMFLLTDKPIIFLVNTDDVDDQTLLAQIQEASNSTNVLLMDVKTESELIGMEESEKKEFMNELGMDESGLDKLTRLAYQSLGLISFFTEGSDEVRAWTVKKGDSAPDAAGTIHTDFKKNFISAEVCNYADYVENNGWNSSKEKGKVRLEGKTYIVKDGDIMFFKHNG